MEEDYKPKVLPEFKYYKGEGTIHDNPYPREDIRSRFWHGECMFAGLLRDCQNEDEINEKMQYFAKDVPNWRAYLKEHHPNRSARFLRENTERQLAIALYIVTLWGKWCPYDSDDFILDY